MGEVVAYALDGRRHHRYPGQTCYLAGVAMSLSSSGMYSPIVLRIDRHVLDALDGGLCEIVGYLSSGHY